MVRSNSERRIQEKLSKILEKIPFFWPQNRQLIGEGIKLKLNTISPYIHIWDQAIALCIHPLNLKNSYLKLFGFANQLLYMAKDESAGVRIKP